MTPSAPASFVPEGRPLWSLHEDVQVDLGPGRSGPVEVRGRWGTVHVGDSEGLVRDVLDRMTLGPVSLENVPGLDDCYRAWRAGVGDCSAWRRVRATLDLLGGRVVPSLGSDDGGLPLLSLVAERERARFSLPDPPRVGVRLAEGAWLDDGGGRSGPPSLHRTGAAYRVQLLRASAVAVARALWDRSWPNAADLAAATEVPEGTVVDVLAYLAGAGMVAPPVGSLVMDPAGGTRSLDE